MSRIVHHLIGAAVCGVTLLSASLAHAQRAWEPGVGSPVPMYWMLPPATENPNAIAGVSSAALGGVAVLAGITFLSQPLEPVNRCDSFTGQCSLRNDELPRVGGVALIVSGATSAGLGATLALLGAADPATYPHKDSAQAAVSASIAIVGASSIVGGAASLMYAAERDESLTSVGLVMIASGALTLPISVPMWFRGSSHPDMTVTSAELLRSRTPEKYFVTRSPALAATGGTFVGLGVAGFATTAITSWRYGSDNGVVNQEFWIVSGTVLGSASAALIASGAPMLAIGLERVPPGEAYAFQKRVEPLIVPELAASPGGLSLTWHTP